MYENDNEDEENRQSLYDDVDDDDNRLELPCIIDTVDHIMTRKLPTGGSGV